MKKILIIAGLLVSQLSYAQLVADFEENELELDTFVKNGRGGFQSADIYLPNVYNAEFDSWTDWALSTMRDTLTEGFTNSLSSAAGTGNDSDTYAVASAFEPVLLHIMGFFTQKIIKGMYITNNTYAALSMKNGDAFAKKFGGETGDDPDFFKLTIKKWLYGELSSDSIDFYLADYRFEDNSQDYIVKEWTYLDLSELGAADSLKFSLSSSDVGSFGMNTPAFFCIDNVEAEVQSSTTSIDSNLSIQIFPNPTSDYLVLEGENLTGNNASVFDMGGRRVMNHNLTDNRINVQSLLNGNYILVIVGRQPLKFMKR